MQVIKSTFDQIQADLLCDQRSVDTWLQEHQLAMSQQHLAELAYKRTRQSRGMERCADFMLKRLRVVEVSKMAFAVQDRCRLSCVQ